MAVNREFFEYEFVIDGRVNIVIAKDKNTGKIQSYGGFLPASRNADKLDIWGSGWITAPGSMGLLGVEIIKREKEMLGLRSVLSIGGLTTTTVPLQKAVMRYDDVGKMQRFYCLAARNEYRVATVKHYEPFAGDTNYQVQVERLNSIDDVERRYDFSCSEDAYPYKDAWYIRHRFFDYPCYDYQVFGLSEGGSVQALLMCRENEYNGVKVLRIVDYIGKAKLFGGLSEFFKVALTHYEYIDMYCYGFDNTYVLQSGMIELQDGDTNIIPSWFAPFASKNVDIRVGTEKGKAVFFKADGDQDRPNALEFNTWRAKQNKRGENLHE